MGQMMETAKIEQESGAKEAKKVPPIDAEQSLRTETATFALG
jgi:hypothetical protein